MTADKTLTAEFAFGDRISLNGELSFRMLLVVVSVPHDTEKLVDDICSLEIGVIESVGL